MPWEKTQKKRRKAGAHLRLIRYMMLGVLAMLTVTMAVNLFR